MTRETTIRGVPNYIQLWNVAKLDGFIAKLIAGMEREHGALPDGPLFLVLVPRAELSASGGLPSKVRNLTNPRWRRPEFTSCNRLYMAFLVGGEEATCREILHHLSWAEAYRVTLTPEEVILDFLAAVEERDTAA